MSRQVSYEEIGAVTATFIAQSGVEDGMAVKLAGDSTVCPCTAGERFCGVALAPVGGFAAVQVGGFARVKYSGTGVAPGWVSLTADGSGGVKQAGSGDGARDYLVVSADTTAKTAVVRL